jgi:CARDB
VILDSPRSRRKAWRRLFWPALITVVAIVAVAVSAAGRDTRLDLAYLDAVRDQSAELSLDGDALRVVISRLSRIERDELVTAIDTIRTDLQVGQDLVDQGPPSDTLIGINSLYRQAILAWTVGISGFESGILTAADDPSNTVVVDNLANALAEIRDGDRLYEDLVRELGMDEIPDPVGSMPSVVLMPADGELASLADAYVVAARSVNAMIALRPGLGLSQITSDPLWNVNPDDQTVLPATDLVTFSVVVSNKGNVASDPTPLRLTLSGNGDPVVATQQVPVLEPGEQTAIDFVDMAVVAGGPFEVKAELEVIQLDVDLDDNALAVIFMVNEAQSG